VYTLLQLMQLLFGVGRIPLIVNWVQDCCQSCVCYLLSAPLVFSVLVNEVSWMYFIIYLNKLSLIYSTSLSIWYSDVHSGSI
jgi:hypothetical protein